MSWLQDAGYGFRLIGKSRAVFAIAVLTLALGIGANTVIFSVVYSVFIRSFPFHEPERLVVIWETQDRQNLPFMYASPPNYADWRIQNRVFDDLAAFDTRNLFLKQGEEKIRITGTRTTASLFPMLGVKPIAGRWFHQSEDRAGSPPAAILSHDLWIRSFSGDAFLIGKQIVINDVPYFVVGIMPPEFRFPPRIVLEDTVASQPTDLWISFAENAAAGQRGAHYLTVLARLKNGVSIDRAKNDLNTIAKRLESSHPESNAGWGITVVPLNQQVTGASRPALYSLTAAVGLVLLIACANVANLLLARGASRRREYAIRAAIGAGRARIFRQVMIENMLVAAIGCFAGLLLAYWGIRILLQVAPVNIPRIEETSLNLVAIIFSAVVSVVCGLLCGVAPALQSISSDVFTWLRESGNSSAERPGRTLYRKILIVAEVCMAFVLLIGAGLLFRSFLAMARIEPGFRPSNVLTLRTTLPSVTFNTPELRIQAYRQMETALLNRPEIESAGFILDLPLASDHGGTSVTVQGEPAPRQGEEPHVNFTVVTPTYFNTLGVSIIAGRGFTNDDSRDKQPVVLINESAARRIFRGKEPLGRMIFVGFNTQASRQVIGIVRDVRIHHLKEDPPATVYVPYYQVPRGGSMSLAVRTKMAPAAASETIRTVLRNVVPGLPIYEVRTMDQIVSDSLAQPRFAAWMLTLFSASALALACIGLFGFISYVVTQRTREIGIRMALGAQRKTIFRMILNQALLLGVAGLLTGAALCFMLTRFLASLLFAVTPTDPWTLASASALLIAVVTAACIFPARQAMRVDPIVALKQD